MTGTLRVRVSVFVLGALLAIVPTQLVYANIITVTTQTDEVVANGVCSLREAVISLNTGSPVGGCVAVTGPNTIVLNPGTYTLTITGDNEDSAATGDLDIRTSMEIHGSGVANTIIQWDPTLSTTAVDRVFDIFNDSGNVVRIADVTIQNGVARDSGTGEEGGGIFSEATLTLERVVLTNNRSEMDGGGLMNTAEFGGPGVANIIDSTVSNNVAGAFGTPPTDGGGGIYNRGGGTVNLIRSTVSGNGAALLGGGIFNEASTLNATNATISGNHANSDGGGILNTSGGTVNLNNVTISNNTADADNNNSGNGGGLRNISGTVTIANTLIAGNIDATTGGTVDPDCAGTLTSNGFNLVGDTSGCTVSGGPFDKLNIDPGIGPLANNGGPTQTHALLPGSPAIDMGNRALPGSGGNACDAVDQRFVHRAQGRFCDIGAFEFVFRSAPAASHGVLALTALLLVCGGVWRVRRRQVA